MRRSTALLTVLAFLGAAVSPVLAQVATKDRTLNTYFTYNANKINVRIDKIERVAHVDGNPLAKNEDVGDGTKGYLIFSMTIQNAGSDAASLPTFRTSVLLDDQSDVENDTNGPYVMTTANDGPSQLQPKQNVRVRYTVFGVPTDRTITKIILDPNDGAPKARFQIRAGDIATLAEVPRPQPTE